jgi:uncharacterized RDD family membrane protein YckC
METITVRTTQNIDIDYEIGGLGERMLACLIDYAIFLPFAFVALIFANVLGSVGMQVYFIALGLIFLFYDLLCEVFFNGQSLGKRVMEIRVISLDGTRPKFSQYLLRWLFRLVDLTLTSYLCGLFTIIISNKGQRVGDIVAGTTIIKTRARTQMDKIVFAAVDDAYQPVFMQAAQLTDTDIALIHDVLDNYFKTGNSQIVYNMADKLRDVLAISLPPNLNSMAFLQTIIKDYSHITAHTDAL